MELLLTFASHKMIPLKWQIVSISTNKLSRFFAEHACRELWQCKSARSGRLLDLPCEGTNTDNGRVWVDVSTQVTFSQVYTAGSAINNGSVNKRKRGRYGRLWWGVCIGWGIQSLVGKFKSFLDK